MSPLTRDCQTLGAWLIAALVVGVAIMMVGLIVALVLHGMNRKGRS
jgi:hypothetical protein